MSILSRLLSVGLIGSAVACTTISSTKTSSLPVTPPHLLLLGEVHDNPDGHQARYQYLETLVKQGWRPVIAMEQFDLEQNDELQAAMQACESADCVISKVGKNAWQWPLYKPVIQLAMTYHLSVVPANLSRKNAFLAVKEGFKAALPNNIIQQYQLPQSISAAVLSAQENEIKASHCGMAPTNMIGGLAQAQIARDIMMANTMITYAQNKDVVLIAGNGHVRQDIGVPYWLREQHQSDIVAIGFIEKDSNMNSTIFNVHKTIPAHQRPDMCKNLTMQPAK